MSSPSLQPFRQLAQDIRRTSAAKDYTTLGRLLSERINPNAVDVMVYIRSGLGNLTIIGAHVEYWSREASALSPSSSGQTLAREPTLQEMALVLQDARRGVR